MTWYYIWVFFCCWWCYYDDSRKKNTIFFIFFSTIFYLLDFVLSVSWIVVFFSFFAMSPSLELFVGIHPSMFIMVTILNVPPLINTMIGCDPFGTHTHQHKHTHTHVKIFAAQHPRQIDRISFHYKYPIQCGFISSHSFFVILFLQFEMNENKTTDQQWWWCSSSRISSQIWKFSILFPSFFLFFFLSTIKSNYMTIINRKLKLRC